STFSASGACRYSVPIWRSGRVAEGGALLRRYGAEWLHRGFESLLLRSRVAAQSAARVTEGWQSGRMRRSRKPLSVVRRIEGSNPSPSVVRRAARAARAHSHGGNQVSPVSP